MFGRRFGNRLPCEALHNNWEEEERQSITLHTLDNNNSSTPTHQKDASSAFRGVVGEEVERESDLLFKFIYYLSSVKRHDRVEL